MIPTAALMAFRQEVPPRPAPRQNTGYPANDPRRCWLNVAQTSQCNRTAVSGVGLCDQCIELLRREVVRPWMKGQIP